MSPPANRPTHEDIADLHPPRADQACKECRRRKAKCDRSIPACDTCVKYRRHCLYEKHSRTPLTRRHLTEVEEKLERAKLVIAHLRARASVSSPSTTEDAPAVPGVNATRPAHFTEAVESPKSSQCVDDILEVSPKDDFEWDEQETGTSNSAPTESIGNRNVLKGGDNSVIADGMASLAVDERESGYLGVASGAALLRLFATAPRPRSYSTASRASGQLRDTQHSLLSQPDPTSLVTEAMVDAYFGQYHLSYPIVHEATFRAQLSGVIPRPHGDCWLILAYIVATIGVWTTAKKLTNLNGKLFAQARSILSFNILEVGNITLVQALALISNYEQKRNKPNSGYNYSGLALRVAMGLGLHKEFRGWDISPLALEMRRRTWWSLCVFEVGSTITFSRPHTWPREGVETALPLNVDDRSLTVLSKTFPDEVNGITPYAALITQANFHAATTSIYCRVISKPPPSATELLGMDDKLIEPWLRGLPDYFSEGISPPAKYQHAHLVMKWRLRNFRIIMYRPFVIRKAFTTQDRRYEESADDRRAYDICLIQAKETIISISDHVAAEKCNRLEAWYALYFLFQAVLIPCICLRTGSASPAATDWKEQVMATLKSTKTLTLLNANSVRCHQAILGMCGQFMDAPHISPPDAGPPPVQETTATAWTPTVDGGLAARANDQLSPAWFGASPLGVSDVFIGDEAWSNFLRSSADEWWFADS
ncbi:fungal-specific transcription factor domain-containing protein [Astrocystis sublimbata]|nr:fungal-specific transcription factor domain-containing protein [Astrocystis sublimbata]